MGKYIPVIKPLWFEATEAEAREQLAAQKRKRREQERKQRKVTQRQPAWDEGSCIYCHKIKRRRDDGRLVRHIYLGQKCPGSGTTPKAGRAGWEKPAAPKVYGGGLPGHGKKQ